MRLNCSVFPSTSPSPLMGEGRDEGWDGDRNEREIVTEEKKDIRYCPYCGMTAFELSGEEEGSLYCEYCGVDVDIRELVP